MIRVYVLCEGQTEETFVNSLLYQHFLNIGIHLIPILIKTSKNGKGGVVSYGQVKSQIQTLCKANRTSYVTTFLDFYGLPNTFPSYSVTGNSSQRRRLIEQAFQYDIDQPNFIANIISHEFEALLFSKPDEFSNWFKDPIVVTKLLTIRNSFGTPEDINEGITTAPSKRILSVVKGYDKVLHGSLIAIDIGLDIIRRECPNFNNWLVKIENLKP